MGLYAASKKSSKYIAKGFKFSWIQALSTMLQTGKLSVLPGV